MIGFAANIKKLPDCESSTIDQDVDQKLNFREKGASRSNTFKNMRMLRCVPTTKEWFEKIFKKTGGISISDAIFLKGPSHDFCFFTAKPEDPVAYATAKQVMHQRC